MSQDSHCRQKINDQIQGFSFNSGKFLAQMGLYTDCKSDLQNSTYFLTDFYYKASKKPANLLLGLCLPDICTPDQIQQELNKIGESITPILKYTLIAGVPQADPQDQVFEKNWLFYVTIILFIMFGLLGIVAWALSKMKVDSKKMFALKMLNTFDYTETMKIFTYKPNYLNVFNGVKTICMFWVIFGHQFSIRLKNTVNISGLAGQVEHFFYLFVVGAFLAVDVFFFIGGFLVAYSFMREKSKSILKYPFAIIHRVLRFWPSYLMAIAIYYAVYIHTGDGPLWGDNMTLGQIPFCEEAWKSILFVDNLVYNGEKMCMGWGWYLQNDMQIFIFSLFFIFLYTKHKIMGYASIALLIILSIVLNIIEVQQNEYLQVTHLVDFAKWQEYFTNIYIKPWTRCPPYLFGLICGLLHMEYLEIKKAYEKEVKQSQEKVAPKNLLLSLKHHMENKKWVKYMFMTVGVALMLATIILPRDLQVGNTWPQIGHSLYLSLQKISFTLGLYLLVLPSLLEVPNIASVVLDTKFFNFTSKISFWTYLIHFMVVEKMSYGQKLDFYYTPETILPLYVSIALISLALAFFGTILVEVPFSKLEKMLLENLMRGKPRIPKETQSTLTESLLKDEFKTQSKMSTYQEAIDAGINKSIASEQI